MLQKHNWYGNVRELQNTIEKAVILTENNILQANDFFFQTKPASRIKELENFNIMENEKQIIILALEKYKGNMSLTSKMLGINRSTLYDKIKKYEL